MSELSQPSIDLGEQEEHLILFHIPIDRWSDMFAITWYRISYGYIYCSTFELNSSDFISINEFPSLETKDIIIKALIDLLNECEENHSKNFNLLKLSENIPAKFGTANRQLEYEKALSIRATSQVSKDVETM